jgi:signal transduction histidine kinase
VPEHRQQVLAAFQDLAARRGQYEGEYRILRPDGSIRWIHDRGFQVLDEHGGVCRLVGIASDITERKQVEAEVEQMHKQLRDASRQAGMAEVATSVLHNVGNVLNSVNVTATLLSDQIKKSRAADLARVVGLLREHAADLAAFVNTDPKGQKVIEFLAQLGDKFVGDQNRQLEELDLLRKNVEHIKEIVARQQNYAKVSGLTESVNVIDLIEDALRISAAALVRHEIKVVREYAEVPPITTEKHKVLQILVNVVRNAKYACDASGRADKQMTVRVANGNGAVRISVIDNGVGIAPENLNRIFTHGFTTRKDGYGFGLHSGALTARELGGSLIGQSGGVGQGAVFTLELPLQSQAS